MCLGTRPRRLTQLGYTAITEGLATANRFFEQEKEASGQQIRGQVVVLFTDGENNSGREPYTLSVTRNEPACFIFVTISLICLALRMVLRAFPQFVEIS